MHKGSLPHAHLDATMNTQVLWDLVLKQSESAYYIRTDYLVNAQTIGSTITLFQPMPPSYLSKNSSLTDQTYTATKTR